MSLITISCHPIKTNGGLNSSNFFILKRQFTKPANLHIKKSWPSVNKVTRHADLAMDHFDGLYGKVYGRAWPSMRLGLLSPKKHCAILNTFVDTDDLHKRMVEEDGAMDLQRYYKKHLRAYTRWKLREQILENKRARKREMLAKSQNIDINSIDPDSIEVSDVSDSELKGALTTDASEGFSSAEDLMEMFTDRKMDDDEKYFINKASPNLSLKDYVPATELIYREDISNEISYYEGFRDDLELSVEYRDEPPLEPDGQLRICVFPRGSWDTFDSPQSIPVANLLNYYLLDGASVLSVLALDIRYDDVCADYCAAPGGKSLAMLMTLKPKYILCNDLSRSRLSRLSKIMKHYVPNISYFNSSVKITNKDARSLVISDTFDKILVDVPCSNDRNSIETIDNNLFKRSRTEERLRLPSDQCDILKSALKSLKPKGSLVYSTCTLSPIENDGVVQKALLQLQEEDFPGKYAIINLKEAFRPLRGLFQFNTKFKYGQQVQPNVCSNFGPMYLSKIKRLS